MSDHLIETVAHELVRIQERLGREYSYMTPLDRGLDERRARRLARELDQLLAIERLDKAIERLDKELGLDGGGP